MHQLKIGTIPLPKLYVCENGAEAGECRMRGVPYILRPGGMSDTTLVKAVLYKTLASKFPHVKWYDILGAEACHASHGVKVKVPSAHRVNTGSHDFPDAPDNSMQVSDDYRATGGGFDVDDKLEDVVETIEYKPVSIDDYVGDLGWCVSIEELQSLKLLPVFLDDIAKAIKTNIANTSWIDGYNKKLGCPVGHYQGSSSAPNLIILDTSGSIPSGVAGTMVSLIETLRHQCDADLIITSRRSEYWAANEELPGADDLAYLIGGCNECVQFYDILRKHVLGKHWGNVIVFGDNDAPEESRFDIYKYSWLKESELQSTRIDRIMAFHTYADRIPGYGLWAKKAAPNAEVVVNADWVVDMSGRRW